MKTIETKSAPFEVAALPKDALVEIEAVAVVE